MIAHPLTPRNNASASPRRHTRWVREDSPSLSWSIPPPPPAPLVVRSVEEQDEERRENYNDVFACEERNIWDERWLVDSYRWSLFIFVYSSKLAFFVGGDDGRDFAAEGWGWDGCVEEEKIRMLEEVDDECRELFTFVSLVTLAKNGST